jgi:hypothetical protein
MTTVRSYIKRKEMSTGQMASSAEIRRISLPQNDENLLE